MNYSDLMTLLSTPRPNGSPALDETLRSLRLWLDGRLIPHRTHTFTLYPFLWECLGAWIILSRTLLAAAAVLRWGWPALVIALLVLPGGLVDVATGFPLVSFIGRRQGESLILTFDPPDRPPSQELLLSAHADSKTELLDHRQRMFFLKSLRIGILLTVLIGVLSPVDRALLAAASPLAPWSFALQIGMCLALLFLSWGLGLNLSLGRLRPQSTGAVDNGAACAILLGLADRLQRGEIPLEKTRLTLAIFGGEEVNMQGSLAYAKGRAWPLPAAALNLEVMAQDGDYVIWDLDGFSLKLIPTAPEINRCIAQAIQAVTGHPPVHGGPVNSDGGSFLRYGIPAATLGTYHTVWHDRGFHLPSDNLSRIVPARLPEAVEILSHFARSVDQELFFANFANLRGFDPN